MYDIFYVSASNGNDKDWLTLKYKYPLAQRLTNIKSYEEIRSKSFTTMFWVIWDDIELTSFNLLDYKVTKWDDMYVHVFKNSEHYDGICLFPKSLTISQREFSNRFFTDKKEIDIVASIPKGYNRFEITTYDDYLEAVNQSSTEMFWAIWPDVDVDINFRFDYKVPKHNSNIVHIFKNSEHYDGICLFPKNTTVSRREFYHRFFTDKKEIDIIASKPKQYNKYYPSTFKEYQEITDDMFWVVWPEVVVTDITLFETYFSHHNSYDRRENHVFKNLCNNTASYLSGVILCSKYKPLSEREFNKQYAVDKKEYDAVVSKYQYPVHTINSHTEYLDIVNTEKQQMFWCQWPNTEILDNTIFDLYFDPNDGSLDYDRSENHVFKNLCNDTESYLSGLVLFSKSKVISKKEFDRKYLIDKKEHDHTVSRYRYSRYIITSYDDYKNILETETQQMFWCQWPNTEILDNTIFDLYFDPNDGSLDYDRSENHVFKNLCNDTESYLSGLVLFSKSKVISKKEFDRKYLIDKKEHDHTVSRYRYSRYIITSYDDYKNILETETQQLFWCQWPNTEILDNTIFDLYFDPNDGKYDHDRKENHVFKNMCNDTESYQSGLTLFSKSKVISKKEFDRKYLIDKKEHLEVVSRYRYNRYAITTYDDYKNILEIETQQLFWCQWPEIDVIDDTVFDLYFDPNDGKYDHDRAENHVFKNLCNDKETYLCGLVLFSKEKVISQKEFNRKYLIDKKEHAEVVSRYRYNRYVLSSYDNYLDILNNEAQPMFWGIWPEIDVIDDTVFDLYFDPNDGKYDHDRAENHSFKHMFNNTETYSNGIVLLSKDKIIGQREFKHRFLIEQKEHDRLVSKHHVYDVVFISYNEPNADENYNKLLDTCPRAKRVHGVKGIHRAHIKAAELCNTDMIWIVDGDAVIENNFNFDLVMSSYDIDCVHVWRSLNPINNLEYGNGGVKLLPRHLTLDMNTDTPDMTTSISKKFKAMNTVSNTNAFNTDEFATWRSAFRECCKLSSRSIERQYEEETTLRLDTWCSVGVEKPFGIYAIKGAQAGRLYGETNKNNLDALKKINDFDWLQEQFNGI